MITCVTWIPPNACKEWPDKVHEIPIKHLPVKVDNFMPVEPETMKQFLEQETDGSNEEIDNDNKNNNKNKNNSEASTSNIRKRKYSDLQNVESDNQQTKKHKTNDYNLMNDEIDGTGNEADNEQPNEDESESNSDDDRFVDMDDPNEFTKAVLEGYDDEPLDFISRIAGLQSGIGIGPTHYSYNAQQKNNKSREKRHRIITTENIYDTKNDSEIEDIHIKPTDEVFICLGCSEDRESSYMQVHVFDTELRTFYSHHDIILPAFPLCCKWLSHDHYGTNLFAIGSVEESIEIFNLDVMDALEPVCSLGGRIATDKGSKLLQKWNEDIMFNYTEMNQKQKEMTLGTLKKGSHSDAVLCLDWHPHNDSYLFSGSSDQSIKIWDLNTAQCINTMQYHGDKVQQIKLKINDPNVLLSGGFDKNIFLYDIKNKKSKNKPVHKWKVSGEVETLIWHPNNEHLFMCSLDNGYIQCFDIRKNINKSIWHIKGHKKAITSLSFNKEQIELFATASLDKKVKLWHHESPEKKPVLISEQSNKTMGGIFSIDFAPKRLISSILIIGGQDNFGMWDVWSDNKVKRFYNKEKENENEKKREQEMDGKHQHFIMEQTFNYAKGNKIVIDNNVTIDDFLDDD